jgi:uncharacterized protein
VVERERVIAETADFVRSRLAGGGTGHDWWHVERVRRLALRLGEAEGAELFVVELAALLHDVADWKFYGGDEEIGPRLAGEWLDGLGVEPAVVAHVAEIVRDLSFKGAGVARPMRTREGAVVQDADRLDAIGAIGIARAFAYGGWRGRALFEPGVPPEPHATAEAYRDGSGSTINHFSEKLLLLKDRLNTEAARRLAADRHRFMELFLERFHAEWSGEA